MFRRLISLLLIACPLYAQKAIPQTQGRAIVRTGGSHAAIVWSENGVLHKARITQAQYLAIPASGAPVMPAAFTGTAEEWTTLWNSGQAYALGGRETLNTPSGEPELGVMELRADGSVAIFLGDDIDIGEIPSVIIAANEFSGTFPDITTVPPMGKCGLIIIKGVIQSGTINAQCSRDSRSPRSRVGK